jgi:hypothetical protein
MRRAASLHFEKTTTFHTRFGDHMNALPTPELRTDDVLLARRGFTKNLLASGTLAALATALPLNAFAQASKRGKVTALDISALSANTQRELKTNRRATFQSVLSDYFQTTDGFGRPVSLLLLEINDLPEQGKRLNRQTLSAARAQELRESSFSLVFRGPHEIALSQNTYKLKHPVLGELQVFLVPVGQVSKVAAWRDYEAVFNRMAE